MQHKREKLILFVQFDANDILATFLQIPCQMEHFVHRNNDIFNQT